ncbi:MAG: amino acid ABC transporter permease [Planctomycetes bacterium]|nr:amino acid ABC transporter permease [Planctomycetota bacterium]
MINWGLIYTELPNLLGGAARTLLITALAVTIGTILGLLIAILRLSKRWFLRLPASIYVEAFRGTPMLVQILLIWFGVFPMIGLNRVSAIYAGIVALGLNSGAYLGEIFRGGIQSIDKGQREAALSLGMNEVQVMRYVVLPQALANALPSICNEFITLIKDSSLVAIIAVSELTYRAMLVAARRYEYFTMYVGIALIYFAMTFTTSRLLARLERRLRVGQK